MANSGVHLNNDLLAHMALHHLPSADLTTFQVIISTAKSSDTALTLTSVLSQMHESIRDSNNSKSSATALITRKKISHGLTSTYKRCTNGQHNSKTAHTEEQSWQQHPSKSPHNHSRTTANIASTTGRVLCAKAYQVKKTNKSILDSGASHCMFKDKKEFLTHQNQETTIEVANGAAMKGHGVGTVSGSHKRSPISLSGALHVPDLKCNLVSLVQLAQKGCLLIFKEDSWFEVNQDDEVVLSGNIVDVLRELDLELGKFNFNKTVSYTAVNNRTLLHSRRGHPGKIPFTKAFPGCFPPDICKLCILSKHHPLCLNGCVTLT